MAVANLKTIFGGGSGGSFTLKAGQSWGSCGIGTVNTGSLVVSSPTDVISLTGRWAVTSIEISCATPGTGTMTATLVVDGVSVLSSVSVGTNQYIPLFGGLFTALGSANVAQAIQPPIVCNSNMSLTLTRTTADTVTVRYIALAIE